MKSHKELWDALKQQLEQDISELCTLRMTQECFELRHHSDILQGVLEGMKKMEEEG